MPWSKLFKSSVAHHILQRLWCWWSQSEINTYSYLPVNFSFRSHTSYHRQWWNIFTYLSLCVVSSGIRRFWDAPIDTKGKHMRCSFQHRSWLRAMRTLLYCSGFHLQMSHTSQLRTIIRLWHMELAKAIQINFHLNMGFGWTSFTRCYEINMVGLDHFSKGEGGR